MNFLDKMQRKYGKLAIANLMLYIMLGQTIVLCYSLLLDSSLLKLLYFNPILIMKGQIWRLFTFVFIPNTTYPIFFLFAAFLYYSIGSALEHTWGTFKFNVYYLLGMIFNMLGLLIVQLIFYRDSASASYFYLSTYSSITIYLNLSLFLAYAVLYPEVQFLLYGILPIKVKYLAAIDVVFLAYGLISGTIGDRVLVIVSLLNFLLFFGSKLLHSRPTATQKHFKTQQRELKQGPPIKVAFHKCSVCGKTELTDPDMEFRYCSKCSGNHEYCMDHLHNHTHIE